MATPSTAVVFVNWSELIWVNATFPSAVLGNASSAPAAIASEGPNLRNIPFHRVAALNTTLRPSESRRRWTSSATFPPASGCASTISRPSAAAAAARASRLLTSDVLSMFILGVGVCCTALPISAAPALRRAKSEPRPSTSRPDEPSANRQPGGRSPVARASNCYAAGMCARFCVTAGKL